MRKILTAGAAALTLAGAMVATTCRRPLRSRMADGSTSTTDDWGVGLGAGLAGLALGSALAHPYYDDDYGYGPRYYHHYYRDRCVSTRRVWDPYYGGYVIRRFYYDC